MRRPRAICGKGWFGNHEHFHERKRIMMPRFNSFLCRQPYFWRKPERGHESAPSAKENRQAKNIGWSLNARLLHSNPGAPCPRRKKWRTRNSAFGQGRKNRANAEKRAPEKQFISPRQTEQVMNRALSRPCSSDEFHPGQTMKTHTPRSRPNKARHSRHCHDCNRRVDLHAANQSPMFACALQPLCPKSPVSPARLTQKKEQI